MNELEGSGWLIRLVEREDGRFNRSMRAMLGDAHDYDAALADCIALGYSESTSKDRW